MIGRLEALGEMGDPTTDGAIGWGGVKAERELSRGGPSCVGERAKEQGPIVSDAIDGESRGGVIECDLYHMAYRDHLVVMRKTCRERQYPVRNEGRYQLGGKLGANESLRR